jgi:integrase
MSKAADGRSSIHRRSDGRGWEGWVSIGAHPITGKRLRKHVRGATKTEVAHKVEELRHQRDRGAIAVGCHDTLADWLEHWLTTRVAAGLRPNSLSAYRTDLKYVNRSGVGRFQLRELTPEHIERVYAYILTFARPDPADTALEADISEGYRVKYARYGDAYLRPMLADQAVETTLRLLPAD